MDQRHGFAPDPDNPGWYLRPPTPSGRFSDMFGEMRVRVEAADRVRLRITPQPGHRNILETAHGGFLLGLADHALFIGPGALGMARARGGATIDVSAQFLAPVTIGEPLDVVIEILRETGRMVFMRGLMEQAGVRALSFAGTIRKVSPA